MRVILVGETNPGSRTPQRLRALRELGHDVTMVSTTPPGWTYETPPDLVQRLLYRLRLPMDKAGANRALLDAAQAGCDLIVIDNARIIRPATLRQIRRQTPNIRLIWYSEDDTINPVHRSRWMEGCIPLYDLWVTTKSFNAHPREVPKLGARRVLFVNNSYCRHTHAPIAIDDEQRIRWGAAVSFVGTYEAARENDILALAQAGINVRVWGNGWPDPERRPTGLSIENRPVYGDDYRRVVAASDINLCFLRKGNRDLQTCRSLELPAMGACMLHEASPEVESLFTANTEALYFADTRSLIETARLWLDRPDACRRLGVSARARAVADGHDHHHRWDFILSEALDLPCAF